MTSFFFPPPLLSFINISSMFTFCSTAQDDDSHKTIAEKIYHDITTLSSLEDQQQRLGPILKAALPVSRVDSVGDGLPELVTELLPYVGDGTKNFHALLMTAGGGRQQQRHAIVVTQASGSGKSRLAYEEGTQPTSLTVFVRVLKQGGQLTAPWKSLVSLIEPFTERQAVATLEERVFAAQQALSATRLLIACYVRWVALVLQNLPDDCDKTIKQQAALRCLRNGPGDSGVQKIFSFYCNELSSTLPAVGGYTTTLDRSKVDNFVSETDKMLRELLWENAVLVLWYDGAQGLQDEAPIFLSRESFLGARNEESPDLDEGEEGSTRDLLYGLTAAVAELLDGQRWRQALCGPFLELSDRIALDKFSNISDRVTTLHHASHITVRDMIGCLCHFFHIEPKDFSVELEKKLDALSGRPSWFFDKFWRAFFCGQLLERGWSKEVMKAIESKEELFGMMESACDQRHSEKHAMKLVKTAWKDKTEAHGALISPSRLHKELYFAIKMNNSKLTIKANGKSLLIKCGILALQPDADDDTLDLFQHEPLIAHAIKSHGDSIVKTHSVAEDPIFELLRLSHDDPSLSYTKSNKGSLFEMLVAWHFLRARLVGDDDVTLAAVLQPLLPQELALPTALSNYYVPMQRAHPFDTDGFEGLAEGGLLLTNVDTDAGADLAFFVRDRRDDSMVLVLIQAKARAQTSLVDCLRSATPAWQYTQKDQRKTLTTKGAAPAPFSGALQRKRAAFSKFAAEHAGAVSRAVRIAMSVNPYQVKTIQLCNDMNMIEEVGSSPVVLCCSSVKAFGELHDTLVSQSQPAVAGTNALVQHPSRDFAYFWSPFAVEAVGKAVANPGDLKNFRTLCSKFKKDVAHLFPPQHQRGLVAGLACLQLGRRPTGAHTVLAESVDEQ